MSVVLPPLDAGPDLTAVRALLVAAGLPTADLTAAPRADFWGCHEETHLIGVIRLEGYGAVALLRSLDLRLRYVTGTGITPDERAALRWIGNAAA